jgi:hypothetical protein
MRLASGMTLMGRNTTHPFSVSVHLWSKVNWPLANGADQAVVASGARYRRPAVARLNEFEGRGVSYWASAFEAKMCAAGLAAGHVPAPLESSVRGVFAVGNCSQLGFRLAGWNSLSCVAG